MKTEILKTLNMLKEKGVDYADIRMVDRMCENISTEDLLLQNISNSRSIGVGIRVILDGSLGFASTQELGKLESTAFYALDLAKASRTIQTEKIRMAQKDVVVDNYVTPIEVDPFTVSKAEKIELLLKAEETMRKSANLSTTSASMDFQKEEKIYADTEGSYITQTLYESGAGIEALASINDDVQGRTYPNSFRGNHATAGYEYVKSLNLLEHAERIGKEAEMIVNAQECPSGRFDIVIDGSQLALQVHESVGHPVELDRVFGSEAAYAGMSFVTVDKLNEDFKYGSEFVTIVADGTAPKGLGSFGYDDDGIKAQRTVIIDKGIFKNFITSRDTAVKINQKSNGTNRADGWQNIPIVRMTNISLMPGTFELDELFAGIEKGLYLCTNKSWSIDDKRVNFQFGTEIAYEISKGKLTGKIYKNPIYTGITPEFWGSCDGVCNEKYWTLYGTPNCGKGQPPQTAHVGHGTAPARFRNVKVGVNDVK
ncbi:TldD/PmbA family protein [Clostridium sp. FP1]|uniref:TldD/PmbA family protein n=1 Tax=Clostridium sp. FP1 TaxID=2724076 RepID=UPI00192D66EF|nr:TldD/PmbA family protein [Clostridium sp. FP1]MBZ9634496.1 TldD/PmbA family protein [Clostridium sp. FP1]